MYILYLSQRTRIIVVLKLHLSLTISCYVIEEEPCVDVWSELKGTGISGTTTWEDHFSLSSCFARCLKMNQSECQAVQYLRSTRKCSYLHEDEHLHTRTHNNDLTLLVKESRCPRPSQWQEYQSECTICLLPP